MGTSSRELNTHTQAPKPERRIPRRDERGRFAESASKRHATAADRGESTRGGEARADAHPQRH